MTKILIVYASTFGNTRRMAEAVRDGVKSVGGTTANLQETEDTTKDEVAHCDAIVIGSPVRHRTMDSRIKAFIERTLEVLWLKDELVGKVGGVFTVGGGYGNTGAGCEIAQLGIVAAFVASGLIPVPLPKTTPGFADAGMHWGPSGRSGGVDMTPQSLSEAMLQCAYHHGANVARLTHALKGHEIFARGNIAPSEELIKLFSAVGNEQGGMPS